MLKYNGTTVVYPVHRWTKRRYATHTCITRMWSLQSVLWRKGVEGYSWQIATAQLSEQCWPYTENQEQETKDGYRQIFLCE